MLMIEAARLHDPGTCLSHPIAAVQVDVDDGTELLWGFPGGGNGGADAGVVDQNVDPAEHAHGGVDELAAVVWTRHVGAYRDGPSAGVFDKLAGARQPILSTRAECHVGAGLGQRDGEVDAEPAGCAGDDRDPIVDAEAIENCHRTGSHERLAA